MKARQIDKISIWVQGQGGVFVFFQCFKQKDKCCIAWWGGSKKSQSSSKLWNVENNLKEKSLKSNSGRSILPNSQGSNLKEKKERTSKLSKKPTQSK